MERMLAQLGVQPIQEQVAAAAAENRVPAVVTTAPAPSESVAAYASGTAEQRIYTSAPHVETAAAAPSETYHIGDDTVPQTDTREARLPTVTSGESSHAIQALPPTE